MGDPRDAFSLEGRRVVRHLDRGSALLTGMVRAADQLGQTPLDPSLLQGAVFIAQTRLPKRDRFYFEKGSGNGPKGYDSTALREKLETVEERGWIEQNDRGYEPTTKTTNDKNKECYEEPLKACGISMACLSSAVRRTCW